MATKRLFFPQGGSLNAYQVLISRIYDTPGGRNFSAQDILTHQQRFTMRALKGVRQNDIPKIRENLLISLAWSMGIANRFNFDMEKLIWKRFPYACAYCAVAPCACKTAKPKRRKKLKGVQKTPPLSLRGFQEMFEAIYPSRKRTLVHAGVHLAEEMGEVSEAVNAYVSEHKNRQLVSVTEELADYISCLFGVANSARIDVEKEVVKMFSNNCHVCHKVPCRCSVTFINNYIS